MINLGKLTVWLLIARKEWSKNNHELLTAEVFDCDRKCKLDRVALMTDIVERFLNKMLYDISFLTNDDFTCYDAKVELIKLIHFVNKELVSYAAFNKLPSELGDFEFFDFNPNFY